MVLRRGEPDAEIVCGRRCVQQILVRIQRLLIDLDHGVHFLHGGSDVLRVPALDGKVPVRGGILILLEGTCLFRIEHRRCFLRPHRSQQIPCTVLHELVGRLLNLGIRLVQLPGSELLCDGLCLRLGLLPEPAVIDEKVRRRRVSEPVLVLPRQHGGLTDIGVVGGLELQVLVILLRRDVPVLRGDLFIEPLCAAPDRIKFRMLQRRLAAGGYFLEMGVRFFRVPEPLQDATGVVREGSVAAAFRDHDVTVTAGIQISVEIIVRKKRGERHWPVEDLDLWFLCSEEEPGSVERLGIEVREDRVYQLLQFTVLTGIHDAGDGEEHMELRPCCFARFHLHVVPTVMDRKRHAGERVCNIGRIDPCFRILAVIVVAVHGQTIGTEKVIVAAVPVLILGADIVVCHGTEQGIFIGNLNFVHVCAVSRGFPTIGMVEREFHWVTSSQDSVK